MDNILEMIMDWQFILTIVTILVSASGVMYEVAAARKSHKEQVLENRLQLKKKHLFNY